MGTMKRSQDITKLKEVQEALEQERHMFRAFIDQLPDLVYFKDNKHRFILVNKAKADEQHTTPEAMVGKSDADYYPPEIARKTMGDDERVLRTRKPLFDAAEKLIVEGLEKWVDVIKLPLRDTEGKIVGTMGISRDVTAQTKSERRIRHLNRVLRAVSNINQLIIKEKDSQILIEKACQLLVENRGYQNVWIALRNKENELYTLSNATNIPVEKHWKKNLSKNLMPNCVKIAKSKKKLIVIDEPDAKLCDSCPYQDMHPNSAVLVQTLKHAGRNFGIISINLPSELSKDREEQELFQEISADLAFALHNIEMAKRRQNAEARLKENEKKFSTLFEVANDAILILDDKKILECNQKTLEIFNYQSPAEIIGNSIIDFTPSTQPDGNISSELIQNFVNQALSGKTTKFYCRFVNRQNLPLDGEVSMVRMELDGKIFLQVVIRDVSEQLKYEKALEESEKQLRILMSNLPGMAYRGISDEKRTMEFVSDGCKALTGYRPNQMIKNRDISFGDLLHPEDISQMDTLKKAVEKKQPYTLTYRLIRKDKTIRWVWEQGRAIYQKNGSVDCLEGFIADITDQKLMEEALFKSQLKFRTIFDNAADAIFITNIQGEILIVNRVAVDLFGYTLSEYSNKSLLSLLHLPSADFWEILSKEAHIFESDFIRKDTNKLPVEVHTTPISFEDHPAILSIVRDITERKSLEEQFFQAQKMESIGKLAGGVAHDFNNILTVVRGYSDLLLQKLTNEPHFQKMIEQIHKAAVRGQNLTNQLLIFSRKQVVNTEILNLNEILEDIQPMLKRLIGEDVHLHLKLHPEKCYTRADRSQIEQIIVNIAVNARDAMPSGGSFYIESKSVFLDDAYQQIHPQIVKGKYILITFTDTGIGMKKEIQQRIFEPFFTTKEKGQGTGLGLATVYGIVKQAGGNIWVYSEEGKGTSFKVYLPQIDKSVYLEKMTKAEDSIAFIGNETILLVEDDEMVRNLTKTILIQHRYKVIDVASGFEGFEVFQDKHHKIDVVLTDVVMPGLNGWDLVQKIKKINPEIPTIFMSGYTDDIIAQHGVKDEDVNLIHKPFNKIELLRTIRNTLDHPK